MFGPSFAASLPSSAPATSSAKPLTKTSSRSQLLFGGFDSNGSKRQSTTTSSSSANFNMSTSGGRISGPSFGDTRRIDRGDNTASLCVMGSGAKAGLFGASLSSGGGDLSKQQTAAVATLPFGGFGGVGGGVITSNTKSGYSVSGTSSSSALIPAATATSHSVENSCISLDGRSFHSYLFDTSLEQHVIISEIAPFDHASSIGRFGDDTSTGKDALTSSSSIKITTILPSTISDAVNIDPVIGLVCIDGSNSDGSISTRRIQQQPHLQGQFVGEVGGGKPMSILPWMCLYTRTSAFVLSIGYGGHQDDSNDNSDSRCISGTILHMHEPFEKHLLMSPRGSSILRIRGPPGANSSSSSMFHRCGSMAMLLREGGLDEMDSTAGYVLAMYHGLPESIAGLGNSARGKSNPFTEGAVTTPLRFSYEDLVRGMKDTMEAENAAFSSSSLRRDRPSESLLPTKRVVDFCFMNPPHPANGVNGGFAATSILVLCNDGSVYGASPIIFDGTILPRTIVVNALSHLDAEIDASTTFLQSISSNSSDSTTEQECVEARMRQCRAARRYLLDAFGIPDGLVKQPESSLAQQGSYYVCASLVNSRSYHLRDNESYSQALSWHPRLQGPLILPRQSDDPSSEMAPSLSPQYLCIESFGCKAGAGVVDGFVVAHDGNVDNFTPSAASCAVAHVEFGILPGEGSVLLPRFEFESSVDCQLIDDLVRGTGVYTEQASIINGDNCSQKGDGSCTPSVTNATRVPESFIGKYCCLVVDPLDDIMIHVVTRSRVITVTTNAVAVVAESFLARMRESAVLTSTERKGGLRGAIRTKVWSSLEINSNRAAVVGVQVSSDVHLGHISLARLSDGSLQVINITATQCIHETSELMRLQSEHSHYLDNVDTAFRALENLRPLNEILQPLFDRVCDGLSKMGKIVGGHTLPKDAAPENLALFLETQHSCKVNVLVPMEEMSKVLGTRRELLKEMYEHQAAELARVSALLDEYSEKYSTHVDRVAALELSASTLAKRSSALLTATRELRPQITDAEAAYFKDLQRYETSCNKWQDTVDRLHNDATSSCDALSFEAIESGDVQCLIDLPPPKVEVCHKLLRSEAQMLKKLEQKIEVSRDAVEKLSAIVGDNKENHL